MDGGCSCVNGRARRVSMAMLSGASEIGKFESVIGDLWCSVVPNLGRLTEDREGE